MSTITLETLLQRLKTHSGCGENRNFICMSKEESAFLHSEIVRLQADENRFGWLTLQGDSGVGWVARDSVMGRGYRLHQSQDGPHATPRLAIDAAMRGKEKMTTLDLQQFCGVGGRYSPGVPFVFGGFKYATDGRLAVRVPSTEPNLLTETIGTACDDLFKLVRGEFEPKPWPIAAYDHITCCKNSPDCECGNEKRFRPRFVVVGNRTLASYYHHQISKLPGAKFYESGNARDPLRIIFDVGDAIVAVMTK